MVMVMKLKQMDPGTKGNIKMELEMEKGFTLINN